MTSQQKVRKTPNGRSKPFPFAPAPFPSLKYHLGSWLSDWAFCSLSKLKADRSSHLGEEECELFFIRSEGISPPQRGCEDRGGDNSSWSWCMTAGEMHQKRHLNGQHCHWPLTPPSGQFVKKSLQTFKAKIKTKHGWIRVFLLFLLKIS